MTFCSTGDPDLVAATQPLGNSSANCVTIADPILAPNPGLCHRHLCPSYLIWTTSGQWSIAFFGPSVGAVWPNTGSDHLEVDNCVVIGFISLRVRSSYFNNFDPLRARRRERKKNIKWNSGFQQVFRKWLPARECYALSMYNTTDHLLNA